MSEKHSIALKKAWVEKKEAFMKSRKENAVEIRKKAGAKIRLHFVEHPEHRTAISNAQKVKWDRYKKALAWCKENNVWLGEDTL